MSELRSLLEIKIDKPDEAIRKKAKQNWDNILKPIDGLGDFEELICTIAAVSGSEQPDISKRCAVIFCADNGITEESVAQSDRSVTRSVAAALGRGLSSANRLADFVNASVIPVDIGIDCDEEIQGVRNMKVCRGTKNFAKEPAMSEEETLIAINNGILLVKELYDKDIKIISTGEMGIGNTATSAAVLSAILNSSSDELTGRGAGIDDDGFSRKKRVIREAIKKYDFSGYSDERLRAFQVLRTLGGLDIAALAGIFIGGAIYHIPVVIDGVISSTAALTAQKLLPGTKEYMIPSHCGRERGTAMALECLGLTPFINGNMALGEGTGALMLFALLDMVMDYYKNGTLFSDIGIEKYKRFS